MIIFADSETGAKIEYDEYQDEIIFHMPWGDDLIYTVNEWVIMTRLTNSVWFSNLLDDIKGLCYNPACQMGYSGGHSKTSACVPFSQYLKDRHNEQLGKVRKLQMDSGRPTAPIGTFGDIPQPKNKS